MFLMEKMYIFAVDIFFRKYVFMLDKTLNCGIFVLFQINLNTFEMNMVQ